jgi:hypothetical protein
LKRVVDLNTMSTISIYQFTLRSASEGLCAGLGIVSKKLAVAIGGGDGNLGDLLRGRAPVSGLGSLAESEIMRAYIIERSKR